MNLRQVGRRKRLFSPLSLPHLHLKTRVGKSGHMVSDSSECSFVLRGKSLLIAQCQESPASFSPSKSQVDRMELRKGGVRENQAFQISRVQTASGLSRNSSIAKGVEMQEGALQVCTRDQECSESPGCTAAKTCDGQSLFSNLLPVSSPAPIPNSSSGTSEPAPWGHQF